MTVTKRSMPLSACVIILGNENEKNDTPNYFVTNTMTSLRIWCCYQHYSDRFLWFCCLWIFHWNFHGDDGYLGYVSTASCVAWWQWCCWWGIRRVRKIENIDHLMCSHLISIGPHFRSRDHRIISESPPANQRQVIRAIDQSEARWWQHIVPVTV